MRAPGGTYAFVLRTTAPYLYSGYRLILQKIELRNDVLVLLVLATIVESLVSLLGNVRVAGATLYIATVNIRHSKIGRWTHPADFLCDTLCLPLTFLEVCTTTIEFGGIHFLVKTGLNIEKLFVGSKLIPGCVRRPGSKRRVVALTKLSRWSGRTVRLPGLEFTLPTQSFLLANIRVGPEGYESDTDQSEIVPLEREGKMPHNRRWLVWHQQGPMSNFRCWWKR